MINSWKNNLLSLPDSIFFDIMRNYLGDLKTPFNKHDLIRSLTTMISKTEVRSRIFELLDDDDVRLLTAVALLDAAGIEELYDFTRQYYSFLELHNRIANLQERLLICIEYPDQNNRSGKKLIRLNPVFEDELTASYLDNSKIFRSLSTTDTRRSPLLNEQLISAFISYTINNQGIFDTSGVAKKRAEAAWSNIFSNSIDEDDISLFIRLKEICSRLGFISAEPGNFSIKFGQIEDFGKFTATERINLLAAAAVSSFRPEASCSLETSVKIVSHLFNSLCSGTRIHADDLHSYFYLIRRTASKSSTDTALFTDELLTDALSFFGFIVKEDDFRMLYLDSTVANDEKLRLQSNFEISAPAGFPLSMEIHAACCCEIKNFDITRNYELTKSAYAAALDSGLKPETIESGLKNASTGGIPQNIGFSLKAWAKEYSSIGLNYGVVMTVSPDRLPLIEHNPGLNEFFTAAPAPGVFILDPAREKEWRKAFKDAGFDMLPSIPLSSPNIQTAGSSVRLRSYGDAVERWQGGCETKSEELIENLAGRISKLRMNTENKLKLEARARKKLILSESQLIASNRPEERGEAGGLDHRAKIRLTERALELDNLLEVTTARDFDLEKRLVKPLRLLKSESETQGKPPVFYIEGIELPNEKEIRVPITKISYLKMLKSSLFTP